MRADMVESKKTPVSSVQQTDYLVHCSPAGMARFALLLAARTLATGTRSTWEDSPKLAAILLRIAALRSRE